MYLHTRVCVQVCAYGIIHNTYERGSGRLFNRVSMVVFGVSRMSLGPDFSFFYFFFFAYISEVFITRMCCFSIMKKKKKTQPKLHLTEERKELLSSR